MNQCKTCKAYFQTGTHSGECRLNAPEPYPYTNRQGKRRTDTRWPLVHPTDCCLQHTDNDKKPNEPKEIKRYVVQYDIQAYDGPRPATKTFIHAEAAKEFANTVPSGRVYEQPEQSWEDLKQKAVEGLLEAFHDGSPEDRHELWSALVDGYTSKYCEGCGSSELPCFCENDE
jgi:hypothetical protein